MLRNTWLDVCVWSALKFHKKVRCGCSTRSCPQRRGPTGIPPRDCAEIRDERGENISFVRRRVYAANDDISHSHSRSRLLAAINTEFASAGVNRAPRFSKIKYKSARIEFNGATRDARANGWKPIGDKHHNMKTERRGLRGMVGFSDIGLILCDVMIFVCIDTVSLRSMLHILDIFMPLTLRSLLLLFFCVTHFRIGSLPAICWTDLGPAIAPFSDNLSYSEKPRLSARWTSSG